MHGTFWSRVWLPVIPILAESHQVFAPDYPGFCRSEGRLEPEEATAPALAQYVLQMADALGVEGSLAVAGHDIGGAVAQHVAVSPREGRVSRLALVNSVLYDSWPVPALEQFRDDPKYVRNIVPDELVEQRRQALRRASVRELSEAEEEEYLSPWRTQEGTRSWTAVAQAADARYTEELVEPLKETGLPTLLLWGEEDEFQPIGYAQRFAREMHYARLIAVLGRATSRWKMILNGLVVCWPTSSPEPPNSVVPQQTRQGTAIIQNKRTNRFRRSSKQITTIG